MITIGNASAAAEDYRHRAVTAASLRPLLAPMLSGGVDVRFRIAPLTDRDVDELLHEIKGFRLLQGYRGHPAGDVEALRALLLRLSALAEGVPEIAELDLNPVIALPPAHGCRVVDARIKVKRAAGTMR